MTLRILLLSTCVAQVALADVQRLEFQSDDVSIPAYLHIPNGETAKALVVYLHGNPGSALQPDNKLADVLVTNNIAVFRFNYRGLWGNGGDFNLTNGIEDMQNAIDFLLTENNLKRFGIKSQRLVLLGYSFGTAVALSGAHNDDRVDSIVALAPCDHGYFATEFADPDSEIRDFLNDVTEQLFGENGPIDQNPAVFTDDLLANSERFRFEPIAPALANKKLLFFVGINDSVCYAEDHFFPLYRALRDSSHGAVNVKALSMDHGFNGVGADIVYEMAAHWITDTN